MNDVEIANVEDSRSVMRLLGINARDAAAELACTSNEKKSTALREAANAIRDSVGKILAANETDIVTAKTGDVTEAFVDRLFLNKERVEAMALGFEDVASLPDPVGEVIGDWTRPNGLRITRVRVPLGVIGVIYESRPNVTADAGGLCIKSGNAAILRGGSESYCSSEAIAKCIVHGLKEADLPEFSVQLVPTRDRAAVGEMLKMTEHIDVIIPRGGRSLTERVADESRIPVFKHLDGNCHVYVDRSADPGKAVAITVNAKMRRTGICGAAESLLVHKDVAFTILPQVIEGLIAAGCEIRGDAPTQEVDTRVVPANEQDWGTEYLGPIISVRVVDSLEQAIVHVERFGSNHTDSIVTEDDAAASEFFRRVDSGIVLHNASTQFADGGEFGMGAEIGISTGKLHARGPVGVEQLTSYKYLVRGQGQVRP